MDSSVDSSPLLGDIEEGISHSLFHPKKKQETTKEEADRKKRVDFERHRLESMDNPISLENLDEAAKEVAERKHRRETSGAEQEVDFRFPRDSLGRKIVNEDGSPYLPQVSPGKKKNRLTTKIGFSSKAELPDPDYWFSTKQREKAKQEKRKEAEGEEWTIEKAEKKAEGDQVTFCSTLGKCMTITLTAGALAAVATKQLGLWGGKKTKRRRYTRKYTKKHRSRKSRRSKKSSKNNKK